MDTSFWLVVIDNHSVAVSLALSSHDRHFVKSLGPQIDWQYPDADSLLTATDQSLSTAASSVSLPEDEEPSTAAFVLPHSWIDHEGKILPEHLKNIEKICRSLKLRPLGFIAHDEALTEEANQQEGLPVSFILLYFTPTEFTLTLAYLGKIKERLTRPLGDKFNPSQVELALSELQSDSTIPPEIIVFGHCPPEYVDALKNFPWIGKKDLETFLHFPSITELNQSDIANRYCHLISSQFAPQSLPSPLPQPSAEPSIPPPPVSSPSLSDIVEIDAQDLGFSSIYLPPSPPPSPVVEPPPFQPKPKSRFKLPRFSPKLPVIHLQPQKFLLVFAAFPLLALIPAIFSRASITLNLTPYEFDQEFSVTIDKINKIFDSEHKLIPVESKTFTVSLSDSLQTSGQITVGEIARGEIVIFNQHNSVQNLKKGTIFVDSSGKKFQLTSPVQIASSSSNFDTGIITMGQTRANLEAVDIGSEYNLPRDIRLALKDPVDSLIVAKVKDNLLGGSRSLVRAVAAADKTTLEKKLTSLIGDSIQTTLAKEASAISDYLPELTEIKKNRLDFNRAVGEAADELTVSVDNQITVYYLSPDIKKQIIIGFLRDTQGFDPKNFNPRDFTLTLSQGKLNLKGSSLPTVDITLLQNRLSKKPVSRALTIIRQVAPRTYNYQLQRNFSFLGILNPLPLLPQNIKIEVKP